MVSFGSIILHKVKSATLRLHGCGTFTHKCTEQTLFPLIGEVIKIIIRKLQNILRQFNSFIIKK